MTSAETGVCKDCGRRRKVAKPGPRCASCRRDRRREVSDRRHDLHLRRRYGITREDYDAILVAQGGRCAICGIANGRTRRLSLDHDHAIGDGVWQAARGAVCRPCNDVIGRLRDDPEKFRAAARYLEDPPAQRVLRRRKGLE